MNDQTQKTAFAYVTYIRATPEKVWEALTSEAFMRQYWFGAAFMTDWKPGSTWQLRFPDGRIADSGAIVEIDAPRRLVLSWQNEWSADLNKEGLTECVYQLEAQGNVTKLSISHQAPRPDSKVIAAVSGGWPKILSNLKSLLETGELLVF